MLQLQDLDKRNGTVLVASLAPSFPAGFGGTNPLKVVEALRLKGFSFVQETACALERVWQERARAQGNGRGPLLSNCCPRVVELVRRRFPELVSSVPAIPTPMMAHAAMLRRRFGPKATVVFIGPCPFKARETEAAGGVDLVATFAEIAAWLEASGICPESLPEGSLDGAASRDARLGVLQSGTSGMDNCEAFLQRLGDEQRRGVVRARPAQNAAQFVELLACPGGCLNGPGLLEGRPDGRDAQDQDRIRARRQMVLDFALGGYSP